MHTRIYPFFIVSRVLFILCTWIISTNSLTGQIISHDFNASNDGWTTSDNWIRNSASFAGNATNEWHCNPYNNYSSNQSEYVTSGSMDLSGFENMTVSVDIAYKTNNNDGFRLEYNANDGGGWIVLGTNADANWYTDGDVNALGGTRDGWGDNKQTSPHWSAFTHTLPAACNDNSNVQFRFYFASNGSSQDDGVAFDDFIITGTPVAVAINQPGSGYALDFDGSNDYVSLGTSATLRPANTVSVEAWVYAHTAGTWVAIFGNLFDTGSDEAGYGLFTYDNTGNMMFWVQTSGGTTNGYGNYPQATLPLNEWTHFAGTYDGSNLRLYVNGVLEDTDAKTGSIDYSSSPLDARIGQYYDDNESEEFNGLIDELRIWNDARTQTEIRDNMCKKLAGNEAGLLAYYRMDNASGTTIVDRTSNSLNGTLNNMNNSDWVLSGAAIGDDSDYRYTGSWIGQTVDITSNNKGTFEVSNILGNPDGVHTYRVDESPNTTSGITAGAGSNDTYFGTFVVNGTLPTYTAEVDYTDYPDAITEENNLLMYNRADNSANSWLDLVGTLSIASNLINRPLVASRREFMIASSANPLPVELVDFKATPDAEENEVHLFWVTSSEINNDYFTVERTADLNEFELVTQVGGQGTTNETTEYRETDCNPVQGISYYRLSQTDYDGNTEYFDLEKVLMELGKSDENLEIQLYPNPNNGHNLYLKIPNSQNEDLKVLVNDFLGKEFLIDFTVINQGNYSVVAVEMSQKLAAGSYIINISVNGENHQHKLIVQ